MTAPAWPDMTPAERLAHWQAIAAKRAADHQKIAADVRGSEYGKEVK